MADNLVQKKGESTWYVRLAVPADVQDAIGAKVLIQSLKTGLRKEALERRLPILASWKTRIRTAREGTPMPDGWQDDLISTLQGIDQKSARTKLAMMEGAEDNTGTIPTDDELNALDEVSADILRMLIDMHRIRQGQPRGDFKFVDDLGAVSKLFAKAKLTDPYRITPEQEAEADALIAEPASLKIRTSITPARLVAYREFRESRGGAPKHVDQQVGKMERLAAFLKKEGLTLNFDSVDAWLKSLDRAPATLGQYLMAGTAFWKWAIRYDAGWQEMFKDKVSPFLNHDLPQGGGSETAGEKREAFTTDEILKLHTGALAGKNTALADLILLGAYTGSRIEQLCNLKAEDVITQDGIPCFNFLKGKTEAATRVVPIHPALQPVINRLVQDSEDGYLIPVSTDNQYGKRSHGISKAFGHLKTRLGFGPLHVFHGMRNTVITNLVRADVPDAILKEIVGHKTGSITHDIYSRGASTEQKLAAVSKLPIIPVAGQA